MGLITIIIFVITCYGLSNMVVHSSGPFGIFRWWRDFAFNIHQGFGELFTCMMCLPMWIGMLFSSINLLLLNNITFVFTPFVYLLSASDVSNNLWLYLFIIIMDGIFASGSTWLVHTLQEYFEK